MVFGWDISTSIIGITVFDQLDRFVATEYLDLRARKDCSLLDKVEESELWIRDVLERHCGDGHYVHYIEDRLGNFAAGRTMLQTLMKLAAFNLAVSYVIHRESLMVKGAQGVFTRHIHPSTVKALMKKEGLVIGKGEDKKEKTLSYVKLVCPSFPIDLNKNGNPQPWNYDRADAYIIAKAGRRRYPRAA